MLFLQNNNYYYLFFCEFVESSLLPRLLFVAPVRSNVCDAFQETKRFLWQPLNLPCVLKSILFWVLIKISKFDSIMATLNSVIIVGGGGVFLCFCHGPDTNFEWF